jgi:RNA polymerase sigma factor for flagellar operon FliA
MEGLINAAHRFDPRRGVKFGSFAKKRIVGAILDDNRRMHYPRGEARRKVVKTLSLEAFISEGGYSPLEGLLTDRRPTALDLICKADTRREVRDCLLLLNEQERFVIEHYYFAGRELAEISELMGLTVSRASQVHVRALSKLKALLQGTASNSKPASEEVRDRVVCFLKANEGILEDAHGCVIRVLAQHIDVNIDQLSYQVAKLRTMGVVDVEIRVHRTYAIRLIRGAEEGEEVDELAG